MKVQQISKKDLLLTAEAEIKKILNGLMPIKFVKSDLYIVNQTVYTKLIEIDAVLLPHKKGGHNRKRKLLYGRSHLSSKSSKILNVKNPRFLHSI